MNIYSLIQIVIFMVVLLGLAKPLGSYMAKVYQGERTFLDRVLRPIERFIYRLANNWDNIRVCEIFSYGSVN